MTSAFQEYLRRPERLAERLRDTEEQLLEIWAVCTKTTAGFDRIGSGGGGSGSRDGPFAAYAQLVADMKRRREELDETENEMRDFFRKVGEKDPRHGVRDALILRKRYIERTDWGSTQQALIQNGFPCGHLQTAYYWHRGALARAEKIWEEASSE